MKTKLSEMKCIVLEMKCSDIYLISVFYGKCKFVFFYSMTSMVVNIWPMISLSFFHLIEYYYKMFVTRTDNWDKLIYLARCKQICMICYDYTYFQIIKSECESQTQYICDFLPIKVVPYTSGKI